MTGSKKNPILTSARIKLNVKCEVCHKNLNILQVDFVSIDQKHFGQNFPMIENSDYVSFLFTNVVFLIYVEFLIKRVADFELKLQKYPQNLRNRLYRSFNTNCRKFNALSESAF